ncbi:suppressor APC domain-containing protein 2 isoform X3 [Pristis pectinata]|uniref:suppressor APC domain-containing protein 2 isoform X3 n=1 Tax=Pristis pectinata TaxID=685728 RepID=UPI00223DA220|nr:suppressor APC domain-containing protein 2 isoform X3 [Pristis pectinata]
MEPPVPGAEPPELPRGFLQSLRTLFDILDDERRGSVHVLEIESRWRRGGAGQALPPGVLQCLRRAAPASGYLTFERLVAGLRSALLSPGPGGGPEPGHSGDRRHMTRCQSEAACSGIAYGRRQGRDRSELRRHTITSGADYSALKWMKELEQEKDALLQGLEMIDCARDWYLHHIQAIQDHQRSIGQSSADSGEAAVRSSGRLDQLLPKLQLVSRCLADLISCSAKPLARSSNPVNGSDPSNQASVPGLGNNAQVVSMLKEQNRQLTKEVTTKSERITQLEQEKSALIKQLFAARSRAQPENSQLDSTFI